MPFRAESVLMMRMRTDRVSLCVAVMGFAVVATVRATTLVTYNFDSQTPGASTVASGVTASSFATPTTLSYTQGNPTTGFAASTTGFTTSNYFNFSMTPTAGDDLALSSLTLDDKISATGPTNLSLQYALGGSTTYTTVGSAVATSTAFSATPMVTFNLSGVSALQTATNAVNFRVVGTGASSSAGTLRLDNVGVNGTVSPVSTTQTADLRIVDYNVTGESGTVRSGFETIMQGIAAQSVGGIARAADVIAMDEVALKTGPGGASTTADDVVAKLNSVYGAGTYADVAGVGASLGAGTQAIVYKTGTVSVIAAVAVGTISSTGMERQEMRYELRPANTTGSADFYVYAGHWKADTGSANVTQRNVEAQAIRADAATLGTGAHIIYTGDYNLYTSAEPGYATMLAAGTGAAVDPANQSGAWHENAAFLGIDTQSPALTPPAGFASGGVNDRFDFELTTANMIGGTSGLEYVPGSYHTFGNNGSIALDGSVTDAGNTALAGLANASTIYQDLTTQTDHLPVVADYSYTFTSGLGLMPGVSEVPEPSTLLVMGLGCVVLVRRKRGA